MVDSNWWALLVHYCILDAPDFLQTFLVVESEVITREKFHIFGACCVILRMIDNLCHFFLSSQT